MNFELYSTYQDAVTDGNIAISIGEVIAEWNTVIGYYAGSDKTSFLGGNLFKCKLPPSF